MGATAKQVASGKKIVDITTFDAAFEKAKLEGKPPVRGVCPRDSKHSTDVTVYTVTKNMPKHCCLEYYRHECHDCNAVIYQNFGFYYVTQYEDGYWDSSSYIKESDYEPPKKYKKTITNLF